MPTFLKNLTNMSCRRDSTKRKASSAFLDSDNDSDSSDVDDVSTQKEKRMSNNIESDLESIVDDDSLTQDNEDSPEREQMLIVYDRKIKIKINSTTRTEILKLVRRLVLPHEKFICEGNKLGTFSRPDFRNTKTWYYAVLTNGGYTGLSARGLAKVWVTFRGEIAEAFSNHRSYSSVNMKKAFLRGKYTW